MEFCLSEYHQATGKLKTHGVLIGEKMVILGLLEEILAESAPSLHIQFDDMCESINIDTYHLILFLELKFPPEPESYKQLILILEPFND
jgi:hypothetical protein